MFFHVREENVMFLWKGRSEAALNDLETRRQAKSEEESSSLTTVYIYAPSLYLFTGV
jgi:hypothetical protein